MGTELMIRKFKTNPEAYRFCEGLFFADRATVHVHDDVIVIFSVENDKVATLKITLQIDQYESSISLAETEATLLWEVLKNDHLLAEIDRLEIPLWESDEVPF